MMTRRLAKLHPVIVCCAKPARKTFLPTEAGGSFGAGADASASKRDRKWGMFAMLRVLALIMLFSAALDATAALADARQDCEKLRGDAAIQACDQAIGEFPRDAEAHKNRGNAYLAKGDLDRAIADETKAIEIDPKHAASYNNRGNAYVAAGDLDRAIADYAKAIEIDPNDADAYNNRGVAQRAKGDLDRAIADFTKAIEVDPKDAVGATIPR